MLPEDVTARRQGGADEHDRGADTDRFAGRDDGAADGHRRLDREASRLGLVSRQRLRSRSDCSLEPASASRRSSAARARAASARSSARASSASASASESGASVVDGSASESVTGPGQSPARVHRDSRLVPGYTRRTHVITPKSLAGRGVRTRNIQVHATSHVIFSEEENFLIAHAKIFPCVSSWRWWLR